MLITSIVVIVGGSYCNFKKSMAFCEVHYCNFSYFRDAKCIRENINCSQIQQKGKLTCNEHTWPVCGSVKYTHDNMLNTLFDLQANGPIYKLFYNKCKFDDDVCKCCAQTNIHHINCCMYDFKSTLSFFLEMITVKNVKNGKNVKKNK